MLAMVIHAKGPKFDPDMCHLDFMSLLSTDRPWCQYNGLGVELGQGPALFQCVTAHYKMSKSPKSKSSSTFEPDSGVREEHG